MKGGAMAKLPPLGKIDAAFFNEVIYPRLGAQRREVVVGPQHGVDVGIIELGDYALAFTADPIFIVPEYGWERAAWFAFHILFSDAVTSGLSPAFFLPDFNLPPSITEKELELIWSVMDREAKRYGVAVVAGHTARYGGCNYPMVGGAVAVALGPKDKYVSPRFIRPGDAIVVTKGPAVEATGIFAAMFPKFISRRLGDDVAERAQRLFYQMSVVDDALAAVSVGVRDEGVSAMHDATECGLWGGLFELLEAAGLGATIEKQKIPLNPVVEAVCGLFGIDPFASISEGTLILTVRPHRAAEVVEALEGAGIVAAVVGSVEEQRGIRVLDGGRKFVLEHPRVDPFWEAFYSALERYEELEGAASEP